jgi:Protein of unknown function (DUF3485)
MSPKHVTVLIGGLAIITLTGLGVEHFQGNQRLGKAGVRHREIPGKVAIEVLLPEQLEGYRTESLPVTEEELNMLPKDTSFGRRRFVAPDGLIFDLSVVVMGGDQSSIHRPQSCVPAQGWTIASEATDQVTIERPTPYELPFNRLQNSKTLMANGQSVDAESFYLYWFTADGKITANREGRILSTAWRMLIAREVERWAYVSVHVVFPAGLGEAVYPRAKNFLKAAVPHFQVAPGAPPASD